MYCWLVVLQAWDLRSQWKSVRMRAAACLGPTEGLEGVRIPDTNTRNQAQDTDTQNRPDVPFVFCKGVLNIRMVCLVSHRLIGWQA